MVKNTIAFATAIYWAGDGLESPKLGFIEVTLTDTVDKIAKTLRKIILSKYQKLSSTCPRKRKSNEFHVKVVHNLDHNDSRAEKIREALACELRDAGVWLEDNRIK